MQASGMPKQHLYYIKTLVIYLASKIGCFAVPIGSLLFLSYPSLLFQCKVNLSIRVNAFSQIWRRQGRNIRHGPAEGSATNHLAGSDRLRQRGDSRLDTDRPRWILDLRKPGNARHRRWRRQLLKPKGPFCQLKDCLHWRHLLAITPATATSVFTCLGHLGRWDTDRIISIYVMLPKVTKASTSVSLSRVIVAGIIVPPLPM